MRTFNLFLTSVILALLSPLCALAQTESGLLMELEAQKKINKNLSVSLEGDFRTRNDFQTIDRWKIGLGASYKINSWLKADAGYSMIYENNREKVEYYSTYEDDGVTVKHDKVKWRPSYWGIKHRVTASLTGSYKFGNGIRISLRERWQYTYRPEKATTRWKWRVDGSDDIDMTLDDDYVRSGSGKNELRSRFQIEYDRKHVKWNPYASIELFNNWGIDKIRYTAGTDYKINKQHTVGAFYRFQQLEDKEEGSYDPNMHYLGVSYTFKF